MREGDFIESDSRVNLPELREGNYIYHRENMIKYHPGDYEAISDSPWEYKPVILTGPIVNCCDLKPVTQMTINGECSWNDRYFDLEFRHAGEEENRPNHVRVLYNGIYLTGCRYLHHLQNVYHSLTRKELPVASDLNEWVKKYSDFNRPNIKK